MELATSDSVSFTRPAPVVVATFGKHFDGLCVAKSEHHLRAQYDERDGSRGRLVERPVEFLLNRTFEALSEPANLLVDDADVDVHSWPLLRLL